MGCWHGYLSGAMCRVAYGPADATATHCHSKIQTGFTFLVLATLTHNERFLSPFSHRILTFFKFFSPSFFTCMILSNKKYITVAFSALTLLNEHQEEHQAQFFSGTNERKCRKANSGSPSK